MGRLAHRTTPGSTYFVTTKTWQNVSVFHVTANADILISKILEYRDKGNYLLHEFVLMPNHLHLLLTPAGSASLEKALQLIKGGSSYELNKTRKSKIPVWQSGFHDSRVRDRFDYQKKADYIRYNPVTAKLVRRPEQWPYSSASSHIQLDPIPQGLKPFDEQLLKVGPEGPTHQNKTVVSVVGAGKL